MGIPKKILNSFSNKDGSDTCPFQVFDCSIFRVAIHDGLRVVGYPKISQ